MRLQLALLAILVSRTLVGQCTCGADPPAAPPNRTLEPYANEPEDLRPYSKFTKPYYEHYTKSPEYNGAARDVATVKASDVSDVAISFLGPIENHKDQALGLSMLHGAQMAVDEANKRGGYGGKPFRLIIHNDGAQWGASSNEIVKMVYDDKTWGMLGSISGDSTHIALRVSLRAELPIVNSAATDPTIPETIIPWILTGIQDDRVQGYTLARRIYSDLGLKRIALLRVNERYGRFGIVKFKDASRRLGHPVIIEQKFMPGEMDFKRQLSVIQDSRVDGIVVWADAAPAGMILKQMREMGMKQPVFGSFRVMGDDLFRIAGPAAEGLELVYPYDPSRDDPTWVDFQKRFTTRYNANADAFSSLAFDTMNILLNAICRAGLNRGLIRDALYSVEHYKGVTGEMIFDPNAKNIAPLYLGKVKDGKVSYRRYTMEKPYAKVEGASYAGPPIPNATGPLLTMGIFGPGADKIAKDLKQPGYRFVGIASEAAWGKASTELVNLAYDDSLIGFIATDRNSSHLAEQIAVKAFFPLIALSSDRTLTTSNIPWILRLPPSTSIRDAVGVFVDAVDKAGPNREKVREYLAAKQSVAGNAAGLRSGEVGK